MAFYLRPPSGSISLEKLEAFACKRLWFLIKIIEADKNNLILTDLVYKDVSLVADSECLIEGTKKDRISHFILRMAFSESDEMWEWFEKAETILFNFRFLCMKPDEIFQSLQPVWRTVGRLTWNNDSNLLSFKGALKVLQEIPSTCGTWHNVIDKYFAGIESEYFVVPFLYALELVSERKVMLDRGEALVPFCKLHNVMTRIFQNILHFSRPRFQEIQRKLDDERITTLFNHLQRYLKSKVLKKVQFCSEIGFAQLNHEAVDDEVQFFPPCMAYNHKQLRSKHRLKHHARIRYTLFLKEAGLPINEALMFWRNEYSQKCTDHKEVKCSHNWDKDAKRFMYNIRHLYGLEGCHTNYRAHTCVSLQSSCDGCPFVDFDEAHLRDLLCEEKIASNHHETIMALVRQQKPSNACSVYLGEKLKMFTQHDQKLFYENIEQHHSTDFATTMEALSLKKETTSSRSPSLKLRPPLPIHSSSCKKPDCLQIEKTDQFFSDGTSKSPDQIAAHDRKNIIDNSLQSGIDTYAKEFSVTHFENNDCDLHKGQTVSGPESFEGLPLLKQSKRSESLFEESETSFLTEKISCLSTSDGFSESLQKDGGQPNSFLKVNLHIHPNFSGLVSPLQSQLSRLHRDLNCAGNNFLNELNHTRPIEFYKHLKKLLGHLEK